MRYPLQRGTAPFSIHLLKNKLSGIRKKRLIKRNYKIIKEYTLIALKDG
jgi:hypothetical protein